MSALKWLPPDVERPSFDITSLRIGILHLGCGAFHRAHQAVFTQRAIDAEGSLQPAAWGIAAASLRRSDMRDALQPQGGLYTVLERGPDETRAEIVGTLRDVLFVPQESVRFYRYFSDPAIRIVTLTVTPSAYCLDQTTMRLRADHEVVQHDLHGKAPRSAIGAIVRGLSLVRRSGRRPPVIMSCDNLPRNGATLRQAVVDYAALHDDGLSNWIAGSVQFPSSMVDRIVPGAAATDVSEAEDRLGVHDRVPVSAEPFGQWVIEQFEGPRPRWDVAGAQFVADIGPWETSKLRLLNGTHMAMAYLGLLAGLGCVSEFVADPIFAFYAVEFMLGEQASTLPPSPHDILSYAQDLMERWRNPAIVHQFTRIGRDGSEKLQSRLLASIQDNFAQGRRAPLTILAVAAWICCMCRPHCTGRPEDPLQFRLQEIGASAKGDPEAMVGLTLTLPNIFSPDLVASEPFTSDLVKAVGDLQQMDPRRAVCVAMART